MCSRLPQLNNAFYWNLKNVPSLTWCLPSGIASPQDFHSSHLDDVQEVIGNLANLPGLGIEWWPL